MNPPVVECKVNQRRWITSQRQDRHFCTVRYTFLFRSTLSIAASAISTIVAARTSSFQYVRKAWRRQSSPLQRLHHLFLYYSGTRTQSYHTFPTSALGNMRRQYMVSQTVSVIKTEIGLMCHLVEHGIAGDVLVALDHGTLQDMGMSSVGHRLTLLRAVYELKMEEGLEIGEDEWRPPGMEFWRKTRKMR